MDNAPTYADRHIAQTLHDFFGKNHETNFTQLSNRTKNKYLRIARLIRTILQEDGLLTRTPREQVLAQRLTNQQQAKTCEKYMRKPR